jgi:hypothetical protein
MRSIHYLTVLALAAASGGPALAQDNPASEQAHSGSCMANPPLANVVKARDGAKKIATPECDRAVVIPGQSVSFFHKGKAVLVFSGHKGDESDITMDHVAVGSDAPAATTNGRCRFYGNDTAGELLIVCFAAYRNGADKAGAVAMMSVPKR